MAVPRISREDLKARLDAGNAPVILDVRLKYPYEHSALALPGAIRVAPHDPDFSALPPGHDVVAYDSDPDEVVSAAIVAGLIERGVKAKALKGGIGEWLAANFPSEPKGTPPQAAPASAAQKG